MDRDAFIAKVDAKLREFGPEIEWQGILKLGRRHGLLDKNAPGLVPVDKIPQWLKDGLLHGKSVPEAPFDDQIELCPAYQGTIARPAQRSFGRVIKHFDKTNRFARSVQASVAQNVMHYDIGIPGVTWNEAGLFGEVSKPGAEFLLQYLPPERAKHLPGKSLCMPHKGSNNFVEWLFDFLPAILQLKKAGVDPASFDNFVFYHADGHFHHGAFARLGIPKEKLHHLKTDGNLVRMDHMTHIRPVKSVGFL